MKTVILYFEMCARMSMKLISKKCFFESFKVWSLYATIKLSCDRAGWYRNQIDILKSI